MVQREGWAWARVDLVRHRAGRTEEGVGEGCVDSDGWGWMRVGFDGGWMGRKV